MENKTSKYFKYAIGEIILVMIGILLAIQANNWNINRTSKIELDQSLEKLLSELKHDRLILNETLNQNDQYISILDSCLIILKDHEKYTLEKFDELFHYTNYTINFNFSRVNFDELSMSGRLNQIKHPTLTDSLRNYYAYSYKPVENALRDHVRDNIREYTLGYDFMHFVNDTDNSEASDYNIDRKTLEDYSKDIRILNAIRFKIELHRFLEFNYKELIPKTEYLIQTIKQELGN